MTKLTLNLKNGTIFTVITSEVDNGLTFMINGNTDMLNKQEAKRLIEFLVTEYTDNVYLVADIPLISQYTRVFELACKAAEDEAIENRETRYVVLPILEITPSIDIKERKYLAE